MRTVLSTAYYFKSEILAVLVKNHPDHALVSEPASLPIHSEACGIVGYISPASAKPNSLESQME